ncbi:hypothetical protein ANN_03824 [Periplaneta americana]|uniref:MADF domain-containing protein n=1 Tax=Periplaneta americana TaxID=6978 RepID=A0ABQ8U018_PERAM|nr:hypothetical protein ANN_03824 [Periplaneta americana]
MAGLCEGGNEPPGSLKATREGPRPTSPLLASRPHAEAEVDDHPTRMEQEDRDITYALFCFVLCIMEQVLFDEILILSVEENPHVYDKRRASYKDEKMKENMWLSIAASLNTDLSLHQQHNNSSLAVLVVGEVAVQPGEEDRREIRTHDQRPAREKIARSTLGWRAAERGKGPTRRESGERVRAHLVLVERRGLGIFLDQSKQASLVYRSSTRVCVRICVSIRRPEFECSGPQLEGPEFECSGPQLEGPEFEYSELSLKVCGSRYCELEVAREKKKALLLEKLYPSRKIGSHQSAALELNRSLELGRVSHPRVRYDQS